MPFPAHAHDKAYVCIHVFEHTRPILLVSRPEGDWCFLCGDNHADNAADFRVVGIGHVLESDLALLELANLQTDWDAERQSVKAGWIRNPTGSTEH